MRSIARVTAVLLVLSILLSACAGGGAGGDGTETRSFYMGFTPWPYRAEGDYAEVLYTYDLIQQHGDIVAHHFQQGVPYPEAYAMRADPQYSGLPAVATGEISLRAGLTDRVDRIYLAIDCLSTDRKDLTGYYGTDYDSNGSTEQQPRPDNGGNPADLSGFENTVDWSTKGFADQEIADAFVAYSIAMIDYFQGRGFEVAWFNYASEVSELLLEDPTEFADFLVFASRVYPALKAAYPDLPLMVSVALKHPDDPETGTISAAFATGSTPLMDYADILGISVYPYAFLPIRPPSETTSQRGITDWPIFPAAGRSRSARWPPLSPSPSRRPAGLPRIWPFPPSLCSGTRAKRISRALSKNSLQRRRRCRLSSLSGSPWWTTHTIGKIRLVIRMSRPSGGIPVSTITMERPISYSVISIL